MEMTVLESNRLEVEKAIQLVDNLDTTVPYTDYKRSSQKKTFSIITLTHHKPTYKAFLETLLNQETDYTFEIIPIFNHQNEFKSCSQALNKGLSLANSDYCLLTHQDILAPNYWIQRFKESFDILEKQCKVGFLGIAGTSKTGRNPLTESGALYLSNSSASITGKDIKFADMTRQKYGRYKEVQCLDECVMACRTDLGIRYDETNLNHYHFYGADICLYALSKGLKNFAVDADCTHLSDGQQNLSNKSHQDSFINHGSILFKKWRDKFPYFRTTTASFYGPEKIWSPLIFQDVNKKYGTKIPLEIRVM
jgi:glycosyltransferase involved in cell wall biosynthesis